MLSTIPQSFTYVGVFVSESKKDFFRRDLIEIVFAGMWEPILEFISIAAVITNAFIIAYVSDWGIASFKTGYDQLWAVLIFEVR